MGKLWGKNYRDPELEIDNVAEALKNFTIIIKWSAKGNNYHATTVEARITVVGESPDEAVKNMTRALHTQFKARKNKKSTIIKANLSTYNGRILLSTTLNRAAL